MISTKQRAYLRGLANKEKAIFQIGKGGITDEILTELDIVLEKRELIKVTVLETSFITTRGACEAVCEEIGAEPVQCIGNKFVIYRMARAKDNRKIELPK
ncbi:MAG: YhbY family RNA-binding protein [Clostridia bacterium]|nr:YhbY family RNA-binding protein [Clostridia bacterium]